MLQTTFTDFRQHAKTYFDAVEKGEVIRIVRHGKIIAEITPAFEYTRTPSWKQPGLKIALKGTSLTKLILEERKHNK